VGLVVGDPLLMEVDSLSSLPLLDLSRQFGEAQLFASMRISSAYSWARAENGVLKCYFYSAEGAIKRSGDEAVLERELGIQFFDDDSPEAKDPHYYEREDLTFPDELLVLKVAEHWSVNPRKLEEMNLPASVGLLGRYSE
jgi:hypothetical protein